MGIDYMDIFEKSLKHLRQSLEAEKKNINTGYVRSHYEEVLFGRLQGIEYAIGVLADTERTAIQRVFDKIERAAKIANSKDHLKGV